MRGAAVTSVNAFFKFTGIRFKPYTGTDRFTNESTNTTGVTNITFSWITGIDKFHNIL